jgi:hypothetical protein
MMRQVSILALMLFAVAASPAWLRAQQVEDPFAIAVPEREQDQHYVELGKDALSRRVPPWYDAKADDVRALNIPPSRDNEFGNRSSRWSSTPAKTRTPTTVNAPSLGLSWLWTMLQVLFWVVVAGIILFLIYLLVRAFMNREEALVVNTRVKISEAAEDEQQRIESLPFTIARPRGDLLDEAMAAYQSGNYRLAVIFLYSYLLIQLDRNQQIHLARGKTNRMYLRELKRAPRLKEILETTMVAFEDVFFGNHQLSREAFETCWNQLDEFHQQVSQVSP